MRWAWSWAVLLMLSVGLSSTQSLARVPTRLVYGRSPSAKACPDEPALVAAVAARLGYDPFSPWGDQTILASISRASGGFVGQAQLIDHDGIAQGNREVKVPGADCSELILALALAISITLDPLHVDAAPTLEPTPEPEPEPRPESPATADVDTPAVVSAPAPSPRVDVVAKPTPRSSPRGEWHAGVSGSSALGLLPDVSWGGRLSVEARRKRWSIHLEGWAVLPDSREAAGGGAIEASLLAAALAPCFEIVRYTRLCALGSVGSLATRGREVDVARARRVLHAAAGARASVAWPFGSRFELLANVDLAAVLNRPQFQLDGEDVWRPAPLMTVLALGASVRFF